MAIRKHEKGDILVLSPDIQKMRIAILGKNLQHDLSPLKNKIVEFETYVNPYDSILIPLKYERAKKKIYLCYVTGQKLSDRDLVTLDRRSTDIIQFLIPETALITPKERLIQLIKIQEFKGIYKQVVKNANEDFDYLLFSLEISQQGQNPGSRSGIENCVGKEIVELCMRIFPNSKLGDTISEEYYKRFNSK